MKIAVGSDHRGFKTKTKILEYLKKKNYEVFDYGTDSMENTDYTKYAFKVGEAVANKTVDFGIVVCGTGIGISIACNKVRGVRCAKVDSTKEAKLTRKDNDANVLALNGTMAFYKVKDIIDTFFCTKYSNIDRYNKRIEQIKEYEDNNNPILRKVERDKKHE